MIRDSLHGLLTLAIVAALASRTVANDPSGEKDSGLPEIEEKTAGLQEHGGFFRFWWDERAGRIWLEIDRFDEEFLYVNSLATGLGSNPVGLDRGQLGRARLVRFHRVGPKVFLQQRNLRYRAETSDSAERRAVHESFAQSILWGADVAAESGNHVLVDATDFLLRDAHDVVGRLKNRGQNDFRLDKTRSAIYLARTRSFPKNTEFEATLTFESTNPGPLVQQTTPTPKALTVRQHHSFVQLPDDGYRPRRFDPRAPSFATSFADYATPIDQPLAQRWIVRHRLRKKNPHKPISKPVEPIVYYVDRGAPEPVRSALVEGARWWDEAFEAAGFKKAFRVKLLPADADPLDVRYNVIMWVHRSTRGWSYGNSVIDPRTGEIIKGHVTLGSLRVRQDLLLMDGLAPRVSRQPGPAQTCGCCYPQLASAERALAVLAPHGNPVEVALARIRQLSAHEVGHTLGFAHNFAASTYGRASVMDYPAPLVQISDEGELDLSAAYDVGIGEWDKFGVEYAYREFPPDADEASELSGLIQGAIANKQLFLSDADARPAGAAHPLANLWDNGREPLAGLRHSLRVRSIAMQQFGEQAIATGTPAADLEATLVPLYLHHRYQVDAAVKLVGGAYYSYAVGGDGQTPIEWVPVDRQREALALLLSCLAPQHLVIAPRILRQLPPPPFGARDREVFAKRTAMIFDPLAAAEVAAEMVVSNLLQHQRAARLLADHNRTGGFDFGRVLEQLLDATWHASVPDDVSHRAVQRVVQRVVLDGMIRLAGNPQAAPDVRAVTAHKLRRLHSGLKSRRIETHKDDVNQAHRQLARRDIERFLNRPHSAAVPSPPLDAPPGSPIGN